MAAEQSTRDALIAEMLGDIGRLHDAVSSLKEFLPEQTKETEEKLGALINQIDKSGESYKASLEKYNKELSAHLAAKMEQAAQGLQAKVGSVIGAETKQAIEQIRKAGAAASAAKPASNLNLAMLGIVALLSAAVGFCLALYI